MAKGRIKTAPVAAAVDERGTRLLTLVHISDLHFGSPAASEGGQPPTWWRRFDRFDGWLGHSEHAIEHLEQFMRRIEPEKPAVVVTGDLTACGKVAEFEMARKYLNGHLELKNRIAGLELPDVLNRTIPGNHDHWPGANVIWGNPTAGFGQTFGMSPLAPTEFKLGSGCVVRLLGINSDADVWPFGSNRFLARGHFVDELVRLESSIGPPDPREIRVLMVHHSPLYPGVALAVTDPSRKALWARIASLGISVILTGHIHRYIGHVEQVRHRDTTWSVLEARCGTTSQIDEIPARWVAAGEDPSLNVDRLPLNSLLIHRLFDKGGAIWWHCEAITRVHSGFSSKPQWVARSIQVWPR